MKNQKNTFGTILFNLRKEHNLSQQDLSLQLAVSQQCISKWENDVAEPTLTWLWRLADFFDMSVDELIGRKDF
ncbi:MAG: helix-turn-helix transcriptional regulator [Clostridia bacterium]|nr:helix-turn-helix transcriptional regulator [Clostridia bacterium]